MYTVDELKKIVSPIAARYGVDRLWLFGSYARGEQTESSDVDLRVDRGDVRGLELCSLYLDLEEALALPVDLVSTSAARPRFLDRIRKDEVLLYDRTRTGS
ncbi:MAG: nucleotidyltransferase domain-containing protein [Clostridia bacterium]|nr:nucleotidyltransferase domain-containing protein [Clostridia bacterium]MBQ3860896.1 nucleotidyltransferase domain-containing protein [Clostridia bacterium]